jgi:HNH endonuclease
LLQIDHIQPVSKEGDSDITNLITSCSSCNAGKSDITLDDRTALTKSRAQLEELQERGEQLEMMMEWRRDLSDLAGDSVEMLCDYWQGLAPGWVAKDHGKRSVKKWPNRYSIEELTTAMDKSAASYLEFNREGQRTSESWNTAFNKIPAICRLDRLAKEQPDLRELYYIRGISRNRTGYFNDGWAIQLLKAARSWGIGIEELQDVALSCSSWTIFRETIETMIDERREQ